MFINPDSSLSILESIPGTKLKTTKDRAHYSLLLTQAKARIYAEITDDSLINTAISYYESTGDKRNLAWSYLYASHIHDLLGNDSLSVKYIKRAALTSENLTDSLLLYYVNYFRGNILKRKYPHDAAFPYLQNALSIARDIQSQSRIIICLRDIAEVHLRLGQTEDARQCLYEGLGIIKHDSLMQYSAALNNSVALSYFAENNYSDALYYINKAEANIPYIRDFGNAQMILALKSSIMSRLCNYDSAEVHIRDMMGDKSLAIRCIAERDMSTIEANRGNYKKAWEHAMKYSNYKDTINTQELSNKAFEFEKKYSLLEAESAKNKAELRVRNIEFSLALIATISLLLILILVFRLQRRKRQMGKMAVARDQLIKDAVVKVQEEASRVVMRERANAGYLADYIMKIDAVMAKVKSIRDMSDSNRIRSQKELTLTPEERDHLIEVVDTCFNGFAAKLRAEYPQLTDNDTLVCSLIKFGTSNPDIALLLGTSEQALKKRKYRIKTERLGLDKDDSIDDWILKRD